MKAAIKMEKSMSIADTFQQLNEQFANRAANYDDQGCFVQENYQDLKAHKLFSVAVPNALGGAGYGYSQLADAITTMAKACGSTALAYAMHSHPLLLNVYKYSQMGDAKAEATLRKIAEGELIIAGTGANDWLQSNGTAVPEDNGYRINAHKRFVSGGPGAQVFVTSAIVRNAEGDQVIHFSIPFSTPGITIQNNWNTLGMRGTGSNDVIMKDAFVPDAAIVAKRPAGQWHPMWDMIIPIAMPIIVSCYLGLAERAVQIATDANRGREDKAEEVGELKNQLQTARLARDAMVAQSRELQFTPSLANTDNVFMNKSVATKAIHASVNAAANLVGGAGFFKGNDIERIMRDVRALHFHPLPEATQRRVTGRLALGMDPFSVVPGPI